LKVLPIKLFTKLNRIGGGQKLNGGGIQFLFMVEFQYENRYDLFSDTPQERQKKYC